MNKFIGIGFLTKDPELFTTTNGVSVGNFTVAVQRKYKNADDKYESDFIGCIAWRNTAEFVHKYFTKGEKIAVVGSIQTRNYEASDGTKRYVTEVIADEVEKLVWNKQDNTQDKVQDRKLEPIDNDASLPF